MSPVCYLLASNFERMPAAALREFSIHPLVSFSIFVLPFLKVRIAESPPRWLDGFGSPSVRENASCISSSSDKNLVKFPKCGAAIKIRCAIDEG